MSATDDRRGFTRVPFQVAVSLKSDHGTLVFGDIWDISLSGLYVTGTAQFPRGCSCEVDMELDGPEGKVHLHMRGAWPGWTTGVWPSNFARWVWTAISTCATWFFTTPQNRTAWRRS